MLKRSLPTILLLASALSHPAIAGTDLPRTETKSFVQSTHPTWKARYQGRRLVALIGGTGIPKDARTAEQFVLDFPNDNKAVFGAAATNTSFEHKFTRTLNNGKKVYSFIQKINDLPVHGSAVRVVANDAGTVMYVGLRTVPSPYPSGFPEDQFTEQQAKNQVMSSTTYSGITTFNTGHEVVFEDNQQILRKVWRFGGRGGGRSLQFFVDTHSGSIVAAIDAILGVDVNGQVSGYSTAGLAPYNGTPTSLGTNLAPTAVGMPGIKVNVAAGCESNISSAFANANGQYNFTGLADGESLTSTLDAEWFKVRSCECCATCNDIECMEYVANTDSCDLFTVCGDTSNPSLVFNPGSSTDIETREHQVAQINAFVAIQETHKWFQNVLAEPWEDFDEPLVVAVNAPDGEGNAHFDHNIPAIGAFASGPLYYNYTQGTTMSHEYGHFIFHTIFPEALLNETPVTIAFHEGVGDILSALMWNTPCMGAGYRIASPQTCRRRLDMADIAYYDVDVNGQLFDTYGLGEVMASAFWDLRTELDSDCFTSDNATCANLNNCAPTSNCDDNVVEEIFADFLFITDGMVDGSVLDEVLMADTDDVPVPNDTNILNGTNNSAAIYAAFRKHGWDNGPPTIRVRWDGPPSYCSEANTVCELDAECTDPPGQTCDGPVLGTDYIVDDSFVPPLVTLITTAKGNPSVPVERWIIGHYHTLSGEPRNIWAITDDWDDAARNVSVRVGKAPDNAAPYDRVRGVGLIEIDSEGQTDPEEPGPFYSNLELYLEHGLPDLARCEVNDGGDGGRISGRVNGDLGHVDAYAIGTEDSNVGKLDITGRMKSVALNKHPNVSSEKTKLFLGSLGAAGVIDISDDIEGDIVIREASGGSIDARPNDITGKIVTGGPFTGLICGANFGNWETNGLPANIKENVIFGPGAKICDSEALVCEPGDFPVDSLLEEASAIDKPRFISFDVQDGGSTQTAAIRVLLSSLHRVDPPYSGGIVTDFSACEGRIQWVGPPVHYKEHSTDASNSLYISDLGDGFCSGGDRDKRACNESNQCPPSGSCVLGPYLANWSSFGTIHVTGSSVIPSSEYYVQVVNYNTGGYLCGSGDTIRVKTARWGDVETPFNPPSSTVQPDLSDVSALVNKFRDAPGAISKVRAMLSGNLVGVISDIHLDVNFIHISACVDAFRGRPYPSLIEGCP